MQKVFRTPARYQSFTLLRPTLSDVYSSAQYFLRIFNRLLMSFKLKAGGSWLNFISKLFSFSAHIFLVKEKILSMFFMIKLKFKRIQLILRYKNLSNIYTQAKQKLHVILSSNIQYFYWRNQHSGVPYIFILIIAITQDDCV